SWQTEPGSPLRARKRESRLVARMSASEIRGPAFRHSASKTRLNALMAHAGYDFALCAGTREASYASSTTVLRRTPICGAATSTTSPGLSHTEGFRCTPAPVGVPVQIKSPGVSVAKVLM